MIPVVHSTDYFHRTASAFAGLYANNPDLTPARTLRHRQQLLRPSELIGKWV